MTKRRDQARIAAVRFMREEEIDRERERERERVSEDFNVANDTDTINETKIVDMDTIITLPKENAIQLAKLIRERCGHAKNLTVEKYNDEIDLNKFFTHMVDST